MDLVGTLVTALIGGGVVSAILTAFFERRKRNADSAEAVSRAAAMLVEPLSKRVDELDQEVGRLRKQISDLEGSGKTKDAEIAKLRASLADRERQILDLQGRVYELECEVRLLRTENDKLRKDRDT